MGAPPRTSNQITMTLYAPDEQSLTMARSVLSRDPHVTLVDFDPTVIEKQKTDCGTASCQHAVDAACSWSALQGAEYYAIANVAANYSSDYECTKYDSHIFDKHDECVEGHEKNQATLASYSLDVYDVKTCSEVKSLSQRITARSWGPEEQSKPEALAKLAERAPVKAEALPDQVTFDAQGQLAGETRDGFYALYRDGAYRGYVKLDGAGTSEQTVQPMYFPMELRAGDALVARGRRKFVDLALGAAIGSFEFDGERRLAAGLSLHVRHYKLDGGLQFGFGVDGLANGATDSTLALFTPEIGWGIPIAPGVVASANLGAGFTVGIQPMGDGDVNAYAGHAIATARVETFLATWFHVSADLGVVYSGTLDDWGGVGLGPAKPMSMRSPVARVFAGFDL